MVRLTSWQERVSERRSRYSLLGSYSSSDTLLRICSKDIDVVAYFKGIKFVIRLDYIRLDIEGFAKSLSLLCVVKLNVRIYLEDFRKKISDLLQFVGHDVDLF